MVLDLGWQDSYEDAEIKDSGITVPGNIDGWRDGEHTGMRLDYIWTAKRHRVLQSKVVLNGISGPVLSDHFGVLDYSHAMWPVHPAMSAPAVSFRASAFSRK